MDRRKFLVGAAVSAGMASLLAVKAIPVLARSATHRPTDGTFHLTDAEWRMRLAPDRYAVLRQAATEPPFSSPLDHQFGAGLYHGAGCDLPLYSSVAKYASGTGWPSFFEHLPGAVITRPDHSYLMDRTEVLCSRCASHLGHVFRDGPPPTGLRYCMNGLALRFVPLQHRPA